MVDVLLRHSSHVMSCAFCYNPVSSDFRCRHDACARSYCSGICQSSDWQSHEHWCGKSAERGTGYTISDSGVGRGDGVFALRNFVRGDKIMVERSSLGSAFETPVGSAGLLALPSGVKAALSCLSSAVSQGGSVPVGDDAVAAMLQCKYTNNAISLGNEDQSSGLFLTIAKVNHSCVGNSEHYYLAEHGVMMLVATADISIGEEVTFSYVHDCTSRAQRTTQLLHWGIVCDCRACVVPPHGGASIGAALDQATRLDAKLVAQGTRGHIEKALATGHKVSPILGLLLIPTLTLTLALAPTLAPTLTLTVTLA